MREFLQYSGWRWNVVWQTAPKLSRQGVQKQVWLICCRFFNIGLIWQPINRPRTLCKEKEEEFLRRMESKNFLLCCENWLLQQATLNSWNLWTEPQYFLMKSYSTKRLYLVMTLGSVFNANLKICNIKGTL